MQTRRPTPTTKRSTLFIFCALAFLVIHDFIALGMEQNSETDFEQWLANFDIHFSFKNTRKKSLYEATESIILEKTNVPMLGRIDNEPYFDQNVIKYYADLFRERLLAL